MKKAYCFRIYPNKNQEVKLNKTLTTCRHLYNDALAERKQQAELNRIKRDFQMFPWGKPEWISYEDQANDMSDSKTDFQKEVYSQVLQNTLKRLDRSFKNFFIGFGYPRFKGRNRYDSFTYPQSGFELDEGKLTLSKIGSLKIILHREIEGRIKTCTIKKDVDQWYAIFTVDIEREIENVPVATKIGIDVGLTSLLYDHIVFEDLQIKNMMQNHHLARSISDAGWYQLISLTKSKAEYAGKVVELVNPRGTSQICICGYPVPKTLSTRLHRCPSCGLVLPRDHVSAMVIESRSTAGTAEIKACQSTLNRETMMQEAPTLQGE